MKHWGYDKYEASEKLGANRRNLYMIEKCIMQNIIFYSLKILNCT